MSKFLGNTIEIIEAPEPAPAPTNPYSPRYMPHPQHQGVNIFTYYNPYLKKRVKVLKFGEGVLPSLDNNSVLDTLAVDHFVQHNKVKNNPHYIKIEGIVQKLKERNYLSSPTAAKITNIKMAMNSKNQPLVDTIANILRSKNYVPQTLEDKVTLHAIVTALEMPRFKTGGKRTVKQRRILRKSLRKTRTKKRNN